MLDTLDPQTQHVFRAAALEDEIRAHLVALERNIDSSSRALHYLDIVSRIVPDLRRLNDERFGSSRGVSQHLDEIAAAAEYHNLELCWKRFLALADSPGDNFGTWAI